MDPKAVEAFTIEDEVEGTFQLGWQSKNVSTDKSGLAICIDRPFIGLLLNVRQ